MGPGLTFGELDPGPNGATHPEGHTPLGTDSHLGERQFRSRFFTPRRVGSSHLDTVELDLVLRLYPKDPKTVT